MPQVKHSVFLNHSSRDNWLARVIAERFRAAGAKVWIDEMSLHGGSEILSSLIEGIGKADEVVVLVSNESLKSQWVSAEIGMAAALKKRVTGLLNNVDHDSMAPLKDIKSHELNSFETFMRELRTRIGKRRRKG